MNRKVFLHGLLSALLLLCLNVHQVVAQTPDPGIMGTHAVTKAEYNLGDGAFTPPAAAMFPANMEVRGSVHYPSDIATSGPFPVLLWMHGRHSTCYNTTSLATSSTWPCPTGRLPILSYAGYDYAARTMASHGYIVISISANSINANDGTLPDAGMNARGVLAQHHLDLWNTWNTSGTGPFGSIFIGKLNMQNIGTMGHSRGGEGMVFNAEYNRSLGSPYGIRAVLTLAPVDFHRHVLNKIPLMNIAPYCDGDVSDLQGVHFYDDARYKDSTDETPKHNVLVMGANHNFFNTVWTPGSYIAGGADDWLYTGSNTSASCGVGASVSHRLDTTKQKAVYNTYAAAFYRYYLGKETQFAPILNVTDVIPPASSLVDSSKVFVSYHAGRTNRVDINTVDSVYNFTTNNVGGAVTSTSLVSPAVCGGGLALPVCNSGLGTEQRPHRGTGSIKGLAQMKIRWNDTTANYQNAIPVAYQNFSYVKSLMFRACVNFSETTPGPDMNFTVQLIDSAGAKSNPVVSDFTNALFYQPGTLSMVLPKVLFNTVHLPISSFTGINLAKVRYINFRFNKNTTGAVLISDLALINQECGKLNAFYKDSIAASVKKIFFKDSSMTSYGDTVTRLWKFGHPSSGVNDTSTALNPNHTYSVAGTYTVCEYVTVKRRNGVTCIDTFCKTLVLPNKTGITEINDQQERNISIIPNPAHDYIEVNGAENTDMLRIVNLYGQEVFTTTITQPHINLPQSLPTGFYYVMVISPKGNFYQKILIAR